MSTLFGKNKRKRPVSEKVAEEKPPSEKIDDEQGVAVTTSATQPALPSWASFRDLGLAEPLVQTATAMGFSRPTPVQRTMIPFLLNNNAAHVLALAATGSGKTAAFVLPILQKLQADPYGIYCVILTPTRELAKQIHQQVLALGTKPYRVQSVLCVGGLDMVKQACQLQARPHFCVATPGRLAELLRGPAPPNVKQLRYMVLDEADRLLTSHSGFEKDVAEILLHRSNNAKRQPCQTLLFSATSTKSLEQMEEMAGAGTGRLPLQKFVIHADGGVSNGKKKKKQKTKVQPEDEEVEDDDISESEEESTPSSAPSIPDGLKQEYIFMPSRVRDAYLLTTIRAMIVNGGRRKSKQKGSGWTTTTTHKDDDDDDDNAKARSAIVFVSTCERCALVSGILTQLGVDNVALHSLLSQNRRLAALAKFQSQHVRLLIATDVASRGLDVPTVDLVINANLPRTAVNYIHRVGRTARAGRRGRAISLVGESDVALVQAAEQLAGRSLEKCNEITDEMALKLLGPVTKAARVAKMKLMELGFDELVQKMRERKQRDRDERRRIERRLKQRQNKRSSST